MRIHVWVKVKTDSSKDEFLTERLECERCGCLYADLIYAFCDFERDCDICVLKEVNNS